MCIALLLTACQSADAKEVQQQIASIGEVTEDSGPLLEEIQSAFDELDAKDQKSISNYEELEQAIAEYDQLCADRVIEQIEAIGTVNSDKLTREQQEAIQEARKAYDALDETKQELVDDSGKQKTLENAEEKYESGVLTSVQRLNNTSEPEQTIAELQTLREIYLNLTESQREEIDKSINKSAETTVEVVIEKAEVAVAQKSIKAVEYKKGAPTDAQIAQLIAAIDDYVALSSSTREKVDAKQLTNAIKKYNSYRQDEDAFYIRAQYIQNAETIDYSRLLEYASSYKKNKTQFTFEVEIQGTEKGVLFLTDTVTAVIQGTEDKIYLKDDRKEKSHTFQAGETLTVYGVLDEVKTEKTQQEGSGVFGTNILAKTAEETEVPVVKITYTSMDNLGVLVSNDPDKDENEYLEIEAQREALDEKIAQMPQTK
jgi:hypothetical protein